MEKPNFSDEFKRDAVVQITERGYPMAAVSQRLGGGVHIRCMRGNGNSRRRHQAIPARMPRSGS